MERTANDNNDDGGVIRVYYGHSFIIITIKTKIKMVIIIRMIKRKKK